MKTLLTAAMALCCMAQTPERDLSTIAEWLPGTYDTFAQASADAASNSVYKHVGAVLTITPITVDGIAAGARAFYIEQALAGKEAEPYRQRVIVLKAVDGAVSNELHRVKNPSALIHFDGRKTLALAALERESGCDARWTRESDATFAGSAGTTTRCPSTLRGATHAVSAFILTSNMFTTLDQGLDEAGTVRWGPPQGERGHVFVKRQQ